MNTGETGGRVNYSVLIGKETHCGSPRVTGTQARDEGLLAATFFQAFR